MERESVNVIQGQTCTRVNASFATVLKFLIKKLGNATAKRTLKKQATEHVFHVLLSPSSE